MTVRELIAALSALPEESKDLPVYKYLDSYEDGEMLYSYKEFGKPVEKENCPYHKGDNPWLIQNLPDDQLVVFI